MSKPIRRVDIVTPGGGKCSVSAVFDTGSFYTIIREERLPAGVNVAKYQKKRVFGTTHHKGKLAITGAVVLEIRIGKHWINGEAYVSPQLGTDMILGAGLMQMWDISIKNDNGQTTLHIGRDMNDPDIQTVL